VRRKFQIIAFGYASAGRAVENFLIRRDGQMLGEQV
jgi:hypothetical protein